MERIEKDWNPGTYNKFRGLRLQPAYDLLSAVGALSDAGSQGDVVDLGCGTGVMGDALRQMTTGQLIGLDSSPAMLEQAKDTSQYSDLVIADIADWSPKRPAALIYSNAALQWLGEHAKLFVQLVNGLQEDGVLAVQMPNQTGAVSHQGWQIALDQLLGQTTPIQSSAVLSAAEYYSLLEPFGALRVWETEYMQPLSASDQGHPVRLFTESTYGRPFLAKAGDQADALITAYENIVKASYPLRSDGSVLFPFRRLFMVLHRNAV